MCGPMMCVSFSLLPCILVLMSPNMKVGAGGGFDVMCSPSSLQKTSLLSACWGPWCGAYTPKKDVLCPLVATCTSITLSECGITAAMYGRKWGAMITPTPVPGVSDDEKKNLCWSMQYDVESVECVSEIKRMCSLCFCIYCVS